MSTPTGKRFKTNNTKTGASAAGSRFSRDPKPARHNPSQPSFRPQAQRAEGRRAYVDYRSDDIASAPRPIGVDPQKTGAFSTIKAGQGAVIQDRQNAGETGTFTAIDSHRMAKSARPHVQSHGQNKTKKALLGVVAVLVVVMCVWVYSFVSKDSTLTDTGKVSFNERVDANTKDSVEFDGNKFMLDKDSDGKYMLASQPMGGQESSISKHFSLEGDPVSLVLFDGSFIIAENKSDGTWDVISYTVSDGSVVSKLVNEQGEPVQGEGKVVSSKLDGENLSIELEDGSTQSVSLV